MASCPFECHMFDLILGLEQDGHFCIRNELNRDYRLQITNYRIAGIRNARQSLLTYIGEVGDLLWEGNIWRTAPLAQNQVNDIGYDSGNAGHIPIY